MNNREFFETLLVNGKIRSIQEPYIKVLCDETEVYMGSLIKMFLNSDNVKLGQIIHMSATMIKVYKDKNECKRVRDKVTRLLRNYMEYTSLKTLSSLISSLSISLQFQSQTSKDMFEGFVDYSRVVWVNDSCYFRYQGKDYKINIESIKKNGTFRIRGLDVDTPLLVISKEEAYYIKEKSVRNSQGLADIIVGRLEDKETNLVFAYYTDELSDILMKKFKLNIMKESE